MEYKLLEPQDAALLLSFVDDTHTQYNIPQLLDFLNGENHFAYIAKTDSAIIGFAYGYLLPKPDGRKDLYLHAIDVMEAYQNQGHGTELMRFIHSHAKSLGCRKLFLITNTGNAPACRCYEKAGGTAGDSNDILYIFK